MHIKIGLIGYRNHAKRLLSLLDNNPLVRVEAIYHPKKRMEDGRGTNDLSKLYNLDAVVVSSPNTTHYSYLRTFLEHSSAALFCEKPPVVSFDQLDYLAELPEKKKEHIYFNFNYRFNALNEVLSNVQWMKALGTVIHINIVSTHGLAFKKEFADGWRAETAANAHALLETVGIHYVDLLNFHFGAPGKSNYCPSSRSRQGPVLDTAHIQFDYPQKFNVNMLLSYAAPFRKLVEITGTDGYLSIDAQQACLFAPRDTFDEKGRFAKPPVLFNKEIPKSDTMDSLEKSLSFFVEQVHRRQPLPLSHFNASLESNRLILKLKDSYVTQMKESKRDEICSIAGRKND